MGKTNLEASRKLGEVNGQEYFQNWPKWLNRILQLIISFIAISSALIINSVLGSFRINQNEDPLAFSLRANRIFESAILATMVTFISAVFLWEIALVCFSIIRKGELNFKNWMLFVHLNLIWLSVVVYLKALNVYRYSHPVSSGEKLIEQTLGSLAISLIATLVGLLLIALINQYFRNKLKKS